jgi:hypothetical protein
MEQDSSGRRRKALQARGRQERLLEQISCMVESAGPATSGASQDQVDTFVIGHASNMEGVRWNMGVGRQGSITWFDHLLALKSVASFHGEIP